MQSFITKLIKEEKKIAVEPEKVREQEDPVGEVEVELTTIEAMEPCN